MSKKSQILTLLAEGKEYDEIQETVEGATRQYIRNVASANKRENAKSDEVAEETNESTEQKEMEFENDLEGSNTAVGGKMGDPKTGKEYHEAWVNEKAFECSCGCTLNRKSTYCPNCGVMLDWSGF